MFFFHRISTCRFVNLLCFFFCVPTFRHWVMASARHRKWVCSAILLEILIDIHLSLSLGWNSWNRFGCGVSESIILQTADSLVFTRLAKAGHECVNIDDCWPVAWASTRKFQRSIDQSMVETGSAILRETSGVFLIDACFSITLTKAQSHSLYLYDLLRRQKRGRTQNRILFWYLRECPTLFLLVFEWNKNSSCPFSYVTGTTIGSVTWTKTSLDHCSYEKCCLAHLTTIIRDDIQAMQTPYNPLPRRWTKVSLESAKRFTLKRCCTWDSPAVSFCSLCSSNSFSTSLGTFFSTNERF